MTGIGLALFRAVYRGAMIVSEGGDAPPESSHVGATWKGLRRRRVVSGEMDMDTVMAMAFARADNAHSYTEHVASLLSMSALVHHHVHLVLQAGSNCNKKYWI